MDKLAAIVEPAGLLNTDTQSTIGNGKPIYGKNFD